MPLKKSLKYNAFWNILSNILNILLLFILTPIITKGLGDVQYGIYIILGTIGGALSIINLGLGEATLRYVALYHSKNDKEGVNRVFNATLWLYSLLGIIVTVTFFFMPEAIIRLLNLSELGSDGTLLIQLTLVLFFINFIYGCFTSIPQALQRYDIFSYIQIGQNGIRFIVNILVILLGYGLKGLVVTQLSIGILSLLVVIIISKRLLPFLSLYRIPSRKDYKEVFSYGIFSFISQIVGLVWQYCDNILLSIFIGPQAVSYFSIPMQVIGKVNSTISSGFSVLFPKFASEKDVTTIKSIYIKSTQLSLYLSIIIFVPIAIMIKDFLGIWISSDFAEKSGFIATILAFSYIARGAFLPYDSLLKGLGVPKYIMYITIASSFIILFCDLLLIPSIGVEGVGYSYLLSSLIGVFVIGCIWKKYIKNKNIIAYKIFLFPYLVSIGCFTILLHLKNNISLPTINFTSFLVTGCIVFIINLAITFITIRIVDKDFIHEIYYPFILKLKEKCLSKKQ
ncbi:lipopolysaccharide biosynthesis protein [Bacteroides sp.]